METTRKESKTERTQRRLLEAAKKELLEIGLKSLHEIKINNIARNAGVTKMTLFRHFDNKEELLEQALKAVLSDMDDLVPEPSGDFRSDTIELVRRYESFFKKNPNFIIEISALLLTKKREQTLEILAEKQWPVINKLTKFWLHYQKEGTFGEPLSSMDEASLENTLSALFLGPWLALYVWRPGELADEEAEQPLEAEQFVEYLINPLIKKKSK